MARRRLGVQNCRVPRCGQRDTSGVRHRFVEDPDQRPDGVLADAEQGQRDAVARPATGVVPQQRADADVHPQPTVDATVGRFWLYPLAGRACASAGKGAGSAGKRRPRHLPAHAVYRSNGEVWRVGSAEAGELAGPSSGSGRPPVRLRDVQPVIGHRAVRGQGEVCPVPPTGHQ